MKKKTLLCFIALLIAALAALTFVALKKEVIEGGGTSDHAQRPVTYLEYANDRYPIKRNIDTLLVIGTDNYDNSDSGDFYNFEQADFLVILVLDHTEKTISAIQINRDTMCSVTWLDVLGEVGGSVTEQIALSHTYGSGREDSNKNVVNVVQNLCFNAPVDHYAAFTMQAIPIVNDAVGGVDVTIPTDMTMIDSSFTQGAHIHLMGQQAEMFARARMALGDTDNEARLTRHQLYLDGFIQAARKALAQDSSLTVKIVDECGDALCTDMTTTELSSLVSNLQDYTYTGMETPTGINRKGENYNEFYVDESSLWHAIKAAYCEEKNY